jgi:tartrate dehydrogenase/decarboxylase/D-malate dehydrogenase
MFEPVHGSAPSIAGHGVANPVGAIWSISLLLDHLGYDREAATVLEAIEQVLEERRFLTPDLGGSSSTSDVGLAIADRVADVLMSA